MKRPLVSQLPTGHNNFSLFFFISRPVACIDLIRFVAVFDFRQLSKNWLASCNRACFMYRFVWFSSASWCRIAAVTIIVTRGVFELAFAVYAGYIACGGTLVCRFSQEQRNRECTDVDVRSFSVRRAAELPTCRFSSSQAGVSGPASLVCSGYRCSFPGVKRMGGGVGHPPRSRRG